MKWIYRLFRLFKCPHKYELYKQHSVWNQESNSKMPVAIDYVNRCRFCGKLKRFRLE